MTTAAEKWRSDLASWAIPPEILAAAPESPWIHPPEMFVADDDVPDSLSHQRAREALPPGGSVLDVGCGGGRAAMALAAVAGTVVGVDQQQAMLELFATAAERHGLTHQEILGDWPEADARCPSADVVVCHHVAYNVPDLAPFLLALTRHAGSRVVLEIPTSHPLSNLSPLWRQFWGLERPTRPTAADCVAVAREAGLDAKIDTWLDEAFGARVQLDPELAARYTRIRLCLPPERESDVAAALAAAGAPAPREVATIWWDV